MWLGNEKIYYLSNQDDYALQVLLLDWEGNRAFAEYDTFRIHGNPGNYALEYVFVCGACRPYFIQNHIFQACACQY